MVHGGISFYTGNTTWSTSDNNWDMGISKILYTHTHMENGCSHTPIALAVFGTKIISYSAITESCIGVGGWDAGWAGLGRDGVFWLSGKRRFIFFNRSCW